MTEDLRLTSTLTVPAGELQWHFSRSGGPGGQGVNTADSKAELRFDLGRTTAIPPHLRDRALARLAERLVDGVLIVTASEHRAQLANRRAALARLGRLLSEGIAPPARARRATAPSASSVRRRLDSKRRHSELKRQRRSTDD